jgi:uncharacterized protein YbaR (Trm112 family)
MKCLYCKSDLRWNNDFDAEEDEEYSIVSMYECMNEDCKAWYEIYHGKPNKELN